MLKELRNKPIYLVLCIGLFVICYMLFFKQDGSDGQSIEQEATLALQQEVFNKEQDEALVNNEQREENVRLHVDIKGAVHQPGVYTFQIGERLIDAITAAGGYLDQADASLINHALKLTDEMVIYVPRKGEVLQDELTMNVVQSPQSSANDSEVININQASEATLTTIPGIGPAKARAIIQYREEHGPFKSIEQLTEVPGIGQKTYEKLASYITI